MAKRRVKRDATLAMAQAADREQRAPGDTGSTDPAWDVEQAKAAQDEAISQDAKAREQRRLKAMRGQRRPRPSWEISLTEEVRLPVEFLVALSAGRSVMLKPFNRQLSLEESIAVADGFRVLIDTFDRMKREILDYDARLEEIEGDATIAIEELTSLTKRMRTINQHCFIPRTTTEDDS